MGCVQRASKHAEAKQYAAAFQLTSEGLKLEVHEKDLRFLLYANRANAAFHLGKYLQAIFDASVAIKLRGDRWRPLLLRSNAYRAIGDCRSAIKVTSSACPTSDSPSALLPTAVMATCTILITVSLTVCWLFSLIGANANAAWRALPV